MIEVVKPGAATTVRGGPIRGRAHLGSSLGGAADTRSLALANAVVGNGAHAGGLEVVLAGPTLRALADVVVAVVGAPFPIFVDDVAVPLGTALSLGRGAVLRIGTCAVGLRCAVAVAGGVDAEEGARLVAGATVAMDAPHAHDSAARNAAPHTVDVAGAVAVMHAALRADPIALRVTDGLQAALFSRAERARFVASTFTVSRDSDRRGVRLDGALIAGAPSGIVTEGAPLGAVQIPPSGAPIILGVDQCTTGGYAKIANVVTDDMWLLGQLRPGARVRFQSTGVSLLTATARPRD